MLFNSLEYVLFLPLVVALYFATPHQRRWALLLAASYVFYGAWRPEFLLLLIGSTTIDWAAALRMAAATTPRGRKAWLLVSLSANLLILGYFKYAEFLSVALRGALAHLGIAMADHAAFHPLLPVGISFYTFQALAYTIDVYRGDMPPERHLGKFALYVAFFPQLVAGPIERATRLLPQFSVEHRFDGGRIVSGLTILAWGFFQKLVIADRFAPWVSAGFSGTYPDTAGSVILSAFFFYIQLYADFSGYTDIAIGSARLMGIELMENFNRAYLAHSFSDLWRRWHISLMSWFRDYLLRPLGFSRPGKPKWMRNMMIVFVASGLWHGAASTFLVWGALNGVLIVVGETTRRWRNRMWERGFDAVSGRVAIQRETLELIRLVLARAFIVVALSLTLVLFRAPDLGRALDMYAAFFLRPHTLLEPWGYDFHGWEVLLGTLAVAGFVMVDGIRRADRRRFALAVQPRWIRWSVAYATCILTLMFGEFAMREFVYFQF